jgi:hypothetical protein
MPEIFLGDLDQSGRIGRQRSAVRLAETVAPDRILPGSNDVVIGHESSFLSVSEFSSASAGARLFQVFVRKHLLLVS